MYKQTISYFVISIQNSIVALNIKLIRVKFNYSVSVKIEIYEWRLAQLRKSDDFDIIIASAAKRRRSKLILTSLR